MILEVEILPVRPGQEAAFEDAFRHVSPIIAASPGYHGHEPRHCLEFPGKYLLLVRWKR